MFSGSVQSHALEAYRMIISVQLNSSRREENELKFKTSIENWENLDENVLKRKCHKVAEQMRCPNDCKCCSYCVHQSLKKVFGNSMLLNVLR